MRHGIFLDRASARVAPRGTRPPRQGTLVSGVRLVWLLAISLGVAVPLLAWHYQTQPIQPRTAQHRILKLDATLQARGIQPLAANIAMLGGVLVLVELGAQFGLRAYHRRAILRRAGHADQRIVLRVQTPHSVPQPGARLERDPSPDLFRAVQAALPSRGMRFGHAPYAAFTLVGEPDQPAALQVVIAGGTEAGRKRMATEIRAAIRGQQPHAVIDATPDPLAAAVASAGVVMWREFRLLLPPHYPLRLLDDVERTDLLGPLLAALRLPAGVRCVEVQTVVQPIRGLAASFLHRGWRGHATAFRLRLQHKQEYALKDDASDIERKLEGVPYYTTLRVVCVAEQRAAAINALHAVESALGTYASRTSHLVQRWVSFKRHQRFDLAILARAPRSIPLPALLLPSWLFRSPAILCSDELAGLWHLPTPRIQELVQPLASRYLAAPPAAFIQAHDNERITVGHVQRADGHWTPVGPTLTDLREIMHVIAGQGAGKSRLAANIVQQCLPYGCTVFDGKGDDAGNLTTTVRSLISLRDEARLVLLDVRDGWWPIGLNPLARQELEAGVLSQVLGQVQAVFSCIDPEGWRNSPGMRTLLDMSTLLMLEGEQQPTLAHIKQALADPAYRAELLARTRNPEVRTYWQARRDGLSEREKQSLEALERRFHTLLTNELTRALVVQPEPRFDFGTAMEERLIVLAPVPHITLGGLAGVIGMLIFGAFVRAAVGRPGAAQSRRNYPLIVDEVQVLLEHSDGKDIAMALSQLRAFGVPAVYLHQALAQLGSFKELMQVNAGSRIIMRTKHPDSAALAREYSTWRLTETDISSLDPTQQQYAVLRTAGAQCGPMSMRPLGWPKPVQPPIGQSNGWQSVIGSLSPGAAWQTLTPPESPSPELDQELIRLAYGDQAAARQRLEVLASTLSGGDWRTIRQRWPAIANEQRQHILRNPACIPDRMERQQWLSRLGFATPLPLVELGYRRINQATQRPPPAPPVAQLQPVFAPGDDV